MLPVQDGLYALMANQEYHASGLDTDALTRATVHARRELFDLVRALNALCGHWAQLRPVTTAAQMGVRVSRRLRGRYRITVDDLLHGRTHEDPACLVTFPVDVHALDPQQSTTFDNQGLRSHPYDTPLRALEADEVVKLLLAGPCVSGDFFAHASYRVTGNAVPMD